MTLVITPIPENRRLKDEQFRVPLGSSDRDFLLRLFQSGPVPCCGIFVASLRQRQEDLVKAREVAMPRKKDGIVEVVKETSASLGQAITAAVETAADYLTPSKS